MSAIVIPDTNAAAMERYTTRVARFGKGHSSVESQEDTYALWCETCNYHGGTTLPESYEEFLRLYGELLDKNFDQILCDSRFHETSRIDALETVTASIDDEKLHPEAIAFTFDLDNSPGHVGTLSAAEHRGQLYSARSHLLAFGFDRDKVLTFIEASIRHIIYVNPGVDEWIIYFGPFTHVLPLDQVVWLMEFCSGAQGSLVGQW